VQVRRLWLTDFRNHEAADLSLPDGLVVLRGENGAGKTNVLEAVGYLATLASFRGSPVEALVREGAQAAVVRAEVTHPEREVLLEAEVSPGGRSRAQVNRQRLRRTRDLLGAVRVTVFTADDLALLKAGPAGRRRFLDDLLVALHPRHDETRSDVERALRQRNALLRQVGGRVSGDDAHTLEVWDDRLARAGEILAAERAALCERLAPLVTDAYDHLAGAPVPIRLTYDAPWMADGLAAALARRRDEELRRRVTLVGPHRDEVDVRLGELPARTHASQGEQRSLTLALRLASHRLVEAETATSPVLLLDDVFSELDEARSRALVSELPAVQTLLTTTGPVPEGVVPAATFEVADGKVCAS